MAFAHVCGPEKKNGFGPFSYKFFVCIRVGLTNAFYFSEKSVRFLGNFLDLTRTKTLGFFFGLVARRKLSSSEGAPEGVGEVC